MYTESEKTVITEIITQKLKDNNLPISNLLGSKSAYASNNKKNLVLFNANIFTDWGKIWWGDIDLTKHYQILETISKEIDVDLYVLYEMDGRFENEDRQDFKNVAVWNTKTGLSGTYTKYFNEQLIRINV